MPRGVATPGAKVFREQAPGRTQSGRDNIFLFLFLFIAKGPLGSSSSCPFLSYGAPLAVVGSSSGAWSVGLRWFLSDEGQGDDSPRGSFALGFLRQPVARVRRGLWWLVVVEICRVSRVSRVTMKTSC